MGRSEIKRILFAGGGTAGHLMPAINIAREMKRIDKGVIPLFVGKRGGIERNIVARFGFDIEEIDVIGMKRSPMGIIRFLLNWNRSVKQALEVIERFDPVAVVGAGGYVSAPAIRAAHKMGKLIFLQEQNSLPGLAARSVAKFADTIFTAYESAGLYLGKSRCRVMGNPIRGDIAGSDRNESIRKFGLNPGKKTLLVLGGSSGAAGINETIAELILSDFLPGDWQILWQTGERDYDKSRLRIAGDKLKGAMLPFIDDMPAAYASADLVLSRAGAMALSEIEAARLASVLIPYPHATGDHQTLNAKILEKAGAAIVINEGKLSGTLKQILTSLFIDEKARNRMSAAAASLGKPNAAREISQIILDRINEV